ncbi:MAG: GntR family transcriptional regulator [Candidatus Promineifilaceae bacterium]|nr:GntR family transcriptional regulator [Candidatus Promineifilaceae bacterium]
MARNGNKKLERYLANEPGPEVEEDALLSDVAYSRLHDALRHGGFKPGDILSTNRISQLLGISRTPVSHAVRRLAQEGIIQVNPGHSILVAALSFQEALDSVDVRMLLEPYQAALVAGKLPTEEKERLLKTLDLMDRAAQEDDRGAWSRADTVFHEILSAYCKNRYLSELVMQSRNRILRTLTDQYTSQQYIIDGTAEHREIAEAIIAGDAQRAEALMLSHIQNVRKNMLGRFS